MRNYEERAKDFVKMLFPLIDDCKKIREFYSAVEIFNRTYSRKVKCLNGLSRVAFVTSDYVVKMDYNQEEVEYIGGCEIETTIYSIAEQEGFAHLFAKISPFEYNGKHFYIMPRIYGINSEDYDNEAFDYMTEEEREFCERYQISDLHCNNFGFRNGHVCVVDYACSLDFLC